MYQRLKLKNGLQLILSPLKETKAVTILAMFPVGSRYEAKSTNGVSHFIEHLMFKGTKKRPTSLDITRELDSVGAEFNAFTSKDHTGYHIKISADEVELAFDILSDMLFNSVFDSAEIDKERGVIIEEINMYEDNPLMYIDSIFEQTVFSNHPLGWLISGPRQVIKDVSREDILKYKNQFYQPHNMVLTVAGNFDKTKVLNLTKKYFNQKSDQATKTNFAEFAAKQAAPRQSILFKDTEQVQVCLGFPAYSLADKEFFPITLMSVILGGNMSSRLFTSIREEHGLAYYVKAAPTFYQDTGAFVVQAGLRKEKVYDGIKLILAELKKFRDKGFTSKELKSAKEFLKGKLVLELEDSESVAEWYGKQQLLLGEIFTPEQRLKKILSVSAAEIKKVAASVIAQPKINLALIGPFKSESEFKNLLKL